MEIDVGPEAVVEEVAVVVKREGGRVMAIQRCSRSGLAPASISSAAHV